MKKTKQKILDTARKLFNAQGFGQVTIRMIALELNMSSGNLNYHFRKREDILEALYFEMVEVFDQRVQQLGEQKISLKLMQTDIESSMKRMFDYRFFWTDLYYLLQSNEQIKQHFSKVKADRSKGYQFVFNTLIEQNHLKAPSFSKEYHFLSERMINYSNTWLYASELYQEGKHNTETIQLASFQLLSMMYPYLTNLGQEEFKSIHTNYMK